MKVCWFPLAKDVIWEKIESVLNENIYLPNGIIVSDIAHRGNILVRLVEEPGQGRYEVHYPSLDEGDLEPEIIMFVFDREDIMDRHRAYIKALSLYHALIEGKEPSIKTPRLD